jgi:type VI secretion system ImpM family protein
VTRADGSKALIFGKMPAHGDFIVRGWSAAERDALDAWLSASLAEARALLGTDFEPCFDRAPPWRCAMPAGAIAPSLDSAGRRFPLFVALRGRIGGMVSAECEELLYAAIGGRWDAARLVEALDGIAEDQAGTAQPRWWTEGGEGFGPGALDGEKPPHLLMAMLERERAA